MAKPAENSLLNDYHLLTYDALDSTNAEARRLAGAGASHGAVIWAKKQTAGRGRLGREWVSAEGNLFATIILSPQVALEQCAQLSFVAALAVADTIEAIVPDATRVRCKWPNDVLIAGRKISGVLLETFTTKELLGDRQWVAVGIGINVDSYPEHVLFPAISLREAGVDLISAKIVLSRLVHHFIARYDQWEASGFAPIRMAWQAKAYHLNDAVEVIVGEDRLYGVFVGVDDEGRLLLREGKNQTRTIDAGDVFYPEHA